MVSALAYADEATGYGGARGMREAVDALLQKMDSKGAQARRKNSSAARGKQNVIKAAPQYSLLKELLSRAQADRARELTARRVAAHRALHGRKDRRRVSG